MIALGEKELVDVIDGTGRTADRVMMRGAVLWKRDQTLMLCTTAAESDGKITFYCETQHSPTYFTSQAVPVSRYRSDCTTLFNDGGAYSKVSILCDGYTDADNGRVETVEVLRLSSSVREFVSAVSCLPSLTYFAARGFTSQATVFRPVYQCPALRRVVYKDLTLPRATEVVFATESLSLTQINIENVSMPSCVSLEGAMAGCGRLVSCGMSSFTASETSGVNCDRMLDGCSRLAQLYLPEKIRITSAECMFRGCTSLKFIFGLATAVLDCDLDMRACPLNEGSAGGLIYAGSKSTTRHRLIYNAESYAKLTPEDIEAAPAMGWDISVG